jgi:outer membrane protein assembly factor BamD (BamD/ComL family)
MALVSVSAGIIAGVWRIMNEQTSLEALWPMPAGIVIGLMFWSIGLRLRRNRETTILLRAILDKINKVSRQRDEGGGAIPGDASAVPAGQSEILSQILVKISELNTNLLLTEQERVQRRQEELECRVAGLVEQIEAAVSDGDFDRANELYRHLAYEKPDDPRLETLKKRMEEIGRKDMESHVWECIHQVNDLMSVSRFGEAMNAARELRNRYPDSEEAAELLKRVEHEAGAFDGEQRKRLYEMIRRQGEGRHWKLALDAANELLEKYPDSSEAEAVKAQMPTLVDNTRIEEVRELRDRILDLMDRRRYSEALELSTHVVTNYPETAAASELRAQMPHLRELAADS